MSEPAVAQDPDEPFDLLRPDGTPTGQTKARALVHRDGDWHRAVHIWVAGIDQGGPFLLFQRRNARKDTWPGWLDVAVGGHLRAGEGIAETFREIEEEIGICATPDAARWLGTRQCFSEAEPGIHDRELQEVFLLRDDRPLTDYRPNPSELSALVRFSLPALLDFLADAASAIEASTLATNGTTTVMTYTPGDFIPTNDRYPLRVALAAQRVLRGEPDVTI